MGLGSTQGGANEGLSGASSKTTSNNSKANSSGGTKSTASGSTSSGSKGTASGSVSLGGGSKTSSNPGSTSAGSGSLLGAIGSAVSSVVSGLMGGGVGAGGLGSSSGGLGSTQGAASGFGIGNSVMGGFNNGKATDSAVDRYSNPAAVQQDAMSSLATMFGGSPESSVSGKAADGEAGKTADSGKAATAKPGSLAERAAQVRDALMDEGLSKEQAAGLMGRFQQESTFNPKAMRKNDAGPGLHSKGLGQWNRERLDALNSFAQERNMDVDSLDTQARFAVHELKTSPDEKRAWGKLSRATTYEQAAEAAMDYERPRGYSSKNPRAGHGWDNTLANAKSFYDSFDNFAGIPSATAQIGKTGTSIASTGGVAAKKDSFVGNVINGFMGDVADELGLHPDGKKRGPIGTIKESAPYKIASALLNPAGFATGLIEKSMKRVDDQIGSGSLKNLDLGFNLDSIIDGFDKALMSGNAGGTASGLGGPIANAGNRGTKPKSSILDFVPPAAAKTGTETAVNGVQLPTGRVPFGWSIMNDKSA